MEIYNQEKKKLEALIGFNHDEQHTNEESCDQEPQHYIYKWWHKLEKDLKLWDGYNISKIPDIYDMLKYDMLHNFEKVGHIG